MRVTYSHQSGGIASEQTLTDLLSMTALNLMIFFCVFIEVQDDKKICKYYQKNKCWRGQMCPYRHVIVPEGKMSNKKGQELHVYNNLGVRNSLLIHTCLAYTEISNTSLFVQVP
jgi:hypothetical protein